MTVVKLTIDTSEIDGLADLFRSALTAELNLRGSEPIIEQVLSAANISQFATKGARSETLWAELADGSGRHPLIKTGQMFEALKQPKASISSDGLTADIIYTGEHAGLANIHDGGAQIKRTSSLGKSYTIFIPPRPVSRLIPADIDKITDSIFSNFNAGFAARLTKSKTSRKAKVR